jgi:hypothetical protein
MEPTKEEKDKMQKAIYAWFERGGKNSQLEMDLKKIMIEVIADLAKQDKMWAKVETDKPMYEYRRIMILYEKIRYTKNMGTC